MNWASIIALIALIFSIVCFYLFVMDAIRKPKPEEVAETVARHVQQTQAQAQARAQQAPETQLEGVPALDVATVTALAKGLAETFSKIGPGLVALIGAVLFLLLSGEAARVYNLTGDGAENAADVDEEGEGDGEEDGDANEADANGSGDDADGNEGDGNAAGNSASE